MQAGFLCLESGLTQSKNAINVGIKNITDLLISVMLFWCFGYAVMYGSTTFGLFGTIEYFSPESSVENAPFFIFQSMFCATAGTIVSGAIAERVRYSSYLMISVLLSGIIYTVFGHWVWNGLEEGQSYGWLGEQGFVDFAGSTVVHSVGGWVALAALLIVGARHGRFNQNGSARRLTGHQLPLAMLGVLLLWIGWVGFNGGSTRAMNDQVAPIVLNTIISPVSGGLFSLAAAWFSRGFCTINSVMNGILAGLVAISASCFAVTPLEACIIGGTASLIALALGNLLLKFQIDDAVNAIPVHLGAGIWGTLAVGIFGDFELIGTGLSRWEQIAIQAKGIGVCCLWSFPIGYISLRVIDRFIPLRVSLEDEFRGLNVAEHGTPTELFDLSRIMHEQAETGNLSLRVPAEPYTDVGLIAKEYNAIMDSLQEREERETSLAAQLQQSQKLESIGQLASGIAHDFNNLLGGILGYTSILKEELKSNKAITANLSVIEASTSRAADLAQQLLGLARKKQCEYVAINLEESIGEVTQLLRRTVDKIVSIETRCADELWAIEGDSTQIQQVLMNLGLNARDAMLPAGGRLKFEALNRRIEEIPFDAMTGLSPGNHVCLSVSDTGTGVAEDIRKTIFDPFFTTKEVGKGTGLGLSMVYRIMKKHSGSVTVESEIGKGTTFHLYFPALGKCAGELEAESMRDSRTEGCNVNELLNKDGGNKKKSILVADDEEIIRSLVTTVLKNRGHTVYLAKDGEEAVQVHNDHSMEIDLAILDICMPKMDGMEAFKSMREADPRLKVVFSSGHSESDEIARLKEKLSVKFIQKPFSLDSFIETVEGTF